MSRSTCTALAAAMVVGGTAVRIHNGLTFPLLQGYDAFGHFTYVWYLSTTGRVPLPTSGWSFFHPPLYYALMAIPWTQLTGLDPAMRLRVGTTIVALLGLTHAAVAYVMVRRCVPSDRLAPLLAAALMLFVPVHVYSAAFLGNEGLAAVFCSLAILALLAWLRSPSPPRAIGVGVLLGSAMLTKTSALAVTIAILVAMTVKTIRDGVPARGRQVAAAAAIMLAISGWYYARNVAVYGRPFVMSRGEFMVQQVENFQPQARRSLLEYLLFDPGIFRRPTWPRDAPGPDGTYDALRASVWTGLYANTWFDAAGGIVVPRVNDSEVARRAGQLLLCLGTLPTALTVVGVWSAARRLWRDGWDDVGAPSLLLLATMLTLFVIGTHAVPIPAAVKATYLTPVSVVFAFFFGLGFAHVRRAWPALVPFVALECAAVFAVSLVVFWYGLLFDRDALWRGSPIIAAALENNAGVIEYAGNDLEAAHERFATAAAAGWHVAYENLAHLALDAGRPDEALHLMKRAMRLQAQQSFGRSDDRRRFVITTQAEYLNLLAVVYDALGRDDRALRAARAAVRTDPMIADAEYDVGLLTLRRALASGVPPDRVLLAGAEQHLARACTLDPGFTDAAILLRSARAWDGECAPEADSVASAGGRRYPVETGLGLQHAASIARRRHIRATAQDAGSAPWSHRCAAPAP